MSAATNGKLSPVSVAQVVIDDSFLVSQDETNRTQTIPHEYTQCKETGRIDAFDLTWKPGDEPVPHYLGFRCRQWIEAASYSWLRIQTRP